MALNFKVAKHVTLPLIKMEEEKPLYVRIDGAIYKSNPISGSVPAEGAKKQPPELMNVTNLETGELGQMIVNTVLGSNLREHYPEDSYVGRCFELVRHKIAGSKKYATFSITEIEVEGVKTPAPTAAKSAPAAAASAAKRK